MLMTGIFVVGATVGLGTTWWMNKASELHPAETAMRKFEPVNQGARPARPNGAHGTAGSGRIGAAGTNPAELPYDGKPEEDSAAKAALSMAAIAARAREQTDDLDVPAYPAANKTQGAEAAAPVARPSRKDSAAEAVDSSGGDSPVAQADTPGKKVAGASDRSRPATTAKDQEIERISQQAADELKKKNRGRQLANSTPARPRYSERKPPANAPSYAARVGNKRLAVARCEYAGNLFARERCKWRLCNGMWGQNGCPSYE